MFATWPRTRTTEKRALQEMRGDFFQRDGRNEMFHSDFSIHCHLRPTWVSRDTVHTPAATLSPPAAQVHTTRAMPTHAAHQYMRTCTPAHHYMRACPSYASQVSVFWDASASDWKMVCSTAACAPPILPVYARPLKPHTRLWGKTAMATVRRLIPLRAFYFIRYSG